MTNHFSAPSGAVQALAFLGSLLWKIQSIPVDVFVAGLPAHGRLFSQRTTASALHDPSKDAHAFPEAGLEKFAVLPPSGTSLHGKCEASRSVDAAY